ncbi:MAG TPA: peptidoglycan DD-metalloendopeptidase family protein, partial [Chitinophagaceae bacterium]|nr:peptidoglycan DD-metalloendopeptidase family protein [Chitinophagaceae bacterium]
RKEDQLVKKDQKDDVLKHQTEQVKVLDVQKKEKDQVLGSLKSKERELEKQLAAKKKRDRELQNSIDAIVRRVIEAEKRKAADEAAKNIKTVTPAVPNTTTGGTVAKPVRTESFLELNATEKALGASFESNRAKLPWPVDQGYICTQFGSYQIENTKIKGNNAGITICTPQPGVNVKSVFEGEVVAVFNVGDSKAVMIRHGKYFTVYSNLSSTNVVKGNDVKTGQIIGRVAVDDDDGDGGKLEFVLMIENKNINPEPWLRR